MASFCPGCGSSINQPVNVAAPATSVQQVAAPAPYVVPTTYAQPAQPQVTQGIAIVALLLNILIWPGLGSLIGSRKEGWAQGFLMLGGLILTLTIIGVIFGAPMMIAAWIWGIVTGVQLIQVAK